MLVDGTQPLAQELLTYTSAGGNCRVPVTVSVDFRGQLSDGGVKRQYNALKLRGYDFARAEGEIEVELVNNITAPGDPPDSVSEPNKAILKSLRLPSPILFHPAPFVLLHFEVNAGNQFTSPQNFVPLADKDNVAGLSVEYFGNGTQIAQSNAAPSVLADSIETDSITPARIGATQPVWIGEQLVFLRHVPMARNYSTKVLGGGLSSGFISPRSPANCSGVKMFNRNPLKLRGPWSALSMDLVPRSKNPIPR